MKHIENLIKMANDIGSFFAAEPDRQLAIHSIADHLKRFWEPRMRAAIIDHNRQGGVGLSELVRAALQELSDDARGIVETGDG
jgi:formate dehydrogenase subunit delta